MGQSRVAVLFSSLFLLATSAGATSWYVSPSGSDANTGAVASPFRTIRKAAGMVRPGDVVEVRGGVYNELVSIAAKGTASARITFRSYPGETAVIDGSGLGLDKNLVVFSTAAYVDFSGFEVRNATRIGICGWDANHIGVYNNTVHDSVRNGIYFGYSGTGRTYDITIEGNTVTGNVLENQYHTMSGGWASSVTVQYGDRVRIANNRIYRNDGEGIATIVTSNAVVEGNEVSDNFSVGIYLDNARYARVERNFVYSTNDSRFFRGGAPAAGIGTANEAYAVSNPLSDLTIINNIVVNTKWGFYYGAYENGGGLKNALVANNTFYKATNALIWIENDAHQNSAVVNNIFYQIGGLGTANVSGAGVSYHHNDWYGGLAGAAAGLGDVIANPLLANAGGLAAGDYRLASGSPAFQAGADLSAVARDYWGSARSSSYDIGAQEASVAAGSGSTPSLPGLTAPTNLTAATASSSAISLGWTASSGAASYSLYRNGTAVSNMTTTSWTDQGLAASTTYSYYVTARDSAGVESPASSTASATTSAAPAPEPTPTISAPSNLTASTASTSSIALGWTGSTGAAAYRVYRKGGLVATVTTTSWTDSGLASSTTYSYYVTARDSAGNESAPSNTASATTATPKKHRLRAASQG